MVLTLFFTAVGIGVFVLVFFMMRGDKARWRSKQEKAKSEMEQQHREAAGAGKGGGGRKGKGSLQKGAAAKAIGKPGKAAAEKATHHPLYVNNLKGFAGEIYCVVIDNVSSQICVACGDRTLRVFTIDKSKPIEEAMQNPPYARGNIEADSASACDFTADGQQVVAAMMQSRCLAVHRIAKDPAKGKAMQVVYRTEQPVHKNEVKFLSASKGKWVVTASCDDDTDVKIWSYRGELLASYDTKQVRNYFTTTSLLDGRFVGVAAWSPGIKIMEVTSKNQEFSKLSRAMDLKTDRGANAVAFYPDHKKAIIATKDAALALWTIDVRYHMSEDPRKLHTHQEDDPMFKNWTALAVTPDCSRLVAVAERHIKIFSLPKFECVDKVEDAHQSPILTLAMAPDGHFFATGAADHKPRIWRIP
ncbi:unnamed protein product [Vitrella brassicaformis CCMP3155]|uniref:Uncharacterized protein n=2 Tax=Vitrella brassicaformis TaxID=1169539 RepID=A0A0G4EZR7_VITBC|nr:unnamed protein product [Vitrella brassicaformis CCMP3155]|eukprot:CEM04643.1 unnamed protein product [Vitrella brassicaformis CCMP3155]